MPKTISIVLCPLGTGILLENLINSLKKEGAQPQRTVRLMKNRNYAQCMQAVENNITNTSMMNALFWLYCRLEKKEIWIWNDNTNGPTEWRNLNSMLWSFQWKYFHENCNIFATFCYVFQTKSPFQTSQNCFNAARAISHTLYHFTTSKCGHPHTYACYPMLRWSNKWWREHFLCHVAFFGRAAILGRCTGVGVPLEQHTPPASFC